MKQTSTCFHCGKTIWRIGQTPWKHDNNIEKCHPVITYATPTKD